MKSRGARVLGAALLLSALGAPALSGSPRVQGSPAQSSAEASEPAPPFSARTVSGEATTLDSILREKRFLIMTFWGLNCAPCMKEIARLNALWADPSFREKTAMLAVNTDKIGPRKLVAEMARRRIEIAFPVVADEGYEITNSYVNGLIPLTVLIDRDRRIRMSILGANTEEMEAMEKLVLAGKGGCP